MQIILEQKNPVDSKEDVGLEEVLNLQNRKLTVIFSPAEMGMLLKLVGYHLTNPQDEIIMDGSLVDEGESVVTAARILLPLK